MRVHARVWVLSLICGVLLGGGASGRGRRAGDRDRKVRRDQLQRTSEECGEEEVAHESGPLKFNFFEPKPEITVEEAEEEGFTQAGGRVPYGVTDFVLASVGEYPEKIPTAATTHIRTDVAPGLATNPFAVETCSLAEFGGGPLASVGLFEAPGEECEESEIGTQEATIFTGKFEEGGAGDVPVAVPSTTSCRPPANIWPTGRASRRSTG